MGNLRISLQSLEKTILFGNQLGSKAERGDVICLDGDLGAGKTTLSQAIARGLEVKEDVYVTSPSFALLHEYPGRLPVYHMDFYRLYDCSEVEDLGFDEYFHGDGVCIIEWAVRALEILPENMLHLKIEMCNDGSRLVTCSNMSSSWDIRLKSIVTTAGITTV